VKRAALLALPAGILVALVLYFALRDRTPLLTRAVLAEAQERWRRTGLLDYELELIVEGDRLPPERYRTEVRSGKVARFEQNGRQDDGGADYNVPGIFEWIERELELSSGPTIRGAPAHATLKAVFDAQRGYPLVFKRLAPYGQSRILRVRSFRPVERNR
jgi:hypothetical protein